MTNLYTTLIFPHANQPRFRFPKSNTRSLGSSSRAAQAKSNDVFSLGKSTVNSVNGNSNPVCRIGREQDECPHGCVRDTGPARQGSAWDPAGLATPTPAAMLSVGLTLAKTRAKDQALRTPLPPSAPMRRPHWPSFLNGALPSTRQDLAPLDPPPSSPGIFVAVAQSDSLPLNHAVFLDTCSVSRKGPSGDSCLRGPCPWLHDTSQQPTSCPPLTQRTGCSTKPLGTPSGCTPP